jgi:hypothetical protein
MVRRERVVGVVSGAREEEGRYKGVERGDSESVNRSENRKRKEERGVRVLTSYPLQSMSVCLPVPFHTCMPVASLASPLNY